MEKEEAKHGAGSQRGGCCCGDPFAGLPAQARPRPSPKIDGLRQVTCPRCGLVYRTNRETDLCLECERLPAP
jgi:hypothetical protein